MPRYRLTLEYDGAPFVGWQRQDSGLGVQAVLETAVKNLSGEDALVYGAGRTDSGVHATGQVAHVDIIKEFTGDKIRDALNYHVRPHPVAVLRLRLSTKTFMPGFPQPSGHIYTASSTVVRSRCWMMVMSGGSRCRWMRVPCTTQPRR